MPAGDLGTGTTCTHLWSSHSFLIFISVLIVSPVFVIACTKTQITCVSSSRSVSIALWMSRIPKYLFVIYLFFQIASSQAPIRPNHVALNEKRKHIDVDSSWLDEHGKEVQRVRFIFTSFPFWNNQCKPDSISRHSQRPWLILHGCSHCFE